MLSVLLLVQAIPGVFSGNVQRFCCPAGSFLEVGTYKHTGYVPLSKYILPAYFILVEWLVFCGQEEYDFLKEPCMPSSIWTTIFTMVDISKSHALRCRKI